MLKNYKCSYKRAFTLVELIVVITIIAILGTIAFISMQSYSQTARNSVRISDSGKIKTSLELFFIDSGKYPLPDNDKSVLYSTEIVWSQGTLGDRVKQILGKSLQKKPLDPKFNTEYLYSTTNTRTNYQILSVLEGDLFSSSTEIINNAHASVNVTLKLSGSYNEVCVKTPNYIVPSPSLFISEEIPVSGLELDSVNITSVVVEGGKNIPYIGNGSVETSTGNIDINLSVYSGNLVYGSPSRDKINAMKQIQSAYDGSIVLNSGVYSKIINELSDESLSYLVDDIVFEKPHSEYLVPIVNIDINFGKSNGTIVTCTECTSY